MTQDVSQAGIVEFRYECRNALQVFLLGSFNGWNPRSHPMHRDADGCWSCEVPLAPGIYQFHYLAKLSRHEPGSSGPSSEWSCGNLDYVVISPRGGTIEFGLNRDACEADSTAEYADDPSLDSQENLFPLSRLESALIRGFRQLPDHESRSAFLDVLQESVYC